MNYSRRTAATVSIFIAITSSTFFNLVFAQSNHERFTSELKETADPTVFRAAGLKEYRLGNFAEAVRLLQNATTVAVQANDTYQSALIHNDLGDIYLDEYKLDQAEQEFKTAIHLLRQQPEHVHALARTLGNLGGVLCKGSRNSEALAVVSEASKLVKDRAIHDPQLQVHLLDVAATAYSQQNQFKKAEALLIQALSVLPDNTITDEAVDVANNLGTLYAMKGNYPKAIAAYARALAMAEKQYGPVHPNITAIVGNLGAAYMHSGRYQEAEAQLLRSLAILEENRLSRSPMAIEVLYSLGQISIEENQLERAESLLSRAVETGHAIRARTFEMAETLDLYSTVLRRLSKHPEAENLHSEAKLIRAELAFTTRIGR